MLGWPDDVNPDSIDLFKRRFGITAFRYDARATDEEMLATLGARPSGLDVAAPSAVQVPRLVEAGLIQRLDRSRIPNARHVNAAFRGLAWDPADQYQVPKDYGTTGILYRSGLVEGPLTTWREFRALVTSAAYSGRTVFVDSMADVLAFPLKLLGTSAQLGREARPRCRPRHPPRGGSPPPRSRFDNLRRAAAKRGGSPRARLDGTARRRCAWTPRRPT